MLRFLVRGVRYSPLANQFLGTPKLPSALNERTSDFQKETCTWCLPFRLLI